MTALRSPAGPVPILMYHAVTDTPTAAARRLSVTTGAFVDQVEVLAAHGCSPVTATQLGAAWRDGCALPPHPVLITFDDGYEGVYRHALPALRKYGFTATLFAATGWLRGRDSADLAPGAPDTMLDWNQLRDLAAARLEIGGHSHSHPQLDQLSDERLWFELLRCREILREELGRPPVSFAYPFGYSDRRVRGSVRAAGYQIALAVGNAPARRGQGPYALTRLTVRRSTGIKEFERLVEGRWIGPDIARDRVVTLSYALVRRSRQGMRKVREASV